MNISQNILQSIADEAFGNSQLAWGHASHARRAVIQHALDNPALAPFLAGGIGILRPIAEMPETVPDGHMAVFHWRDDFGSWVTGINKPTNGFFAILRLPDAEATPPAGKEVAK